VHREVYTRELIPVEGAFVSRTSSDSIGIVRNHRNVDGDIEIAVKWYQGTSKLEWVSLGAVRSGFRIGMEVQDVPYSRTRKSLGEGSVLEARTIGGRDQVLVEFPETGKRHWLPYQNLRQVKGPRHRFLLGQLGDEHAAERFRLRNLAYALELWNENTGALSQLDIDPLPHQIHLVHHILASGNLNWLIADDVGLGKTIEVGMLLAALQQRGTMRNILIVTPAGLVKQWQEELKYKFGFTDFEIYGHDFEVNDPAHWKLHNRVIGSIDRFKAEQHLEKLSHAGKWDLVVFDEAHRLSRRQWGQKYDTSERFKLAAELRRTTDSLLLLSATPHQGLPDKFQAILELLRPELKSEIQRLSLEPELLRDLVIRNRKADVTDSEGEFIFQGQYSRVVEVPTGEEERGFDKALRRYVSEGYESARRRGKRGIPIGFVMTVYRKLAASSIYAIKGALERRIARLEGDKYQITESGDDERFSGEQEELQAEAQPEAEDEFFSGEMEMLKDLVIRAEQLAKRDLKSRSLVEDLIREVHDKSPDEKMLIFTEYRATQSYLEELLKEKYGSDSVYLIHGGLNYQERARAIENFEEQGLFLVSTEAGGEGINLHRECHIMVNYDLPWNPMRLVQRIGRLYRYGQTKKVLVFNMHASQTMDAHILQLMYTRIQQIVADMVGVSDEFHPGIKDEILGEFSELLDVGEILEDATTTGVDRTKERVDDALSRAREAVEKQRELFEYASGFDPEETRGELVIGSKHVRAFVEGVLGCLGIEIIDRKHQDRVLELRIPDELREDVPVRRQRFEITFDRGIAVSRESVEMMDFGSPFFCFLIDTARDYQFGGQCAGISRIENGAVISAMLRWQNDQGMRMRQEYAAILVDAKKQVSMNPEVFSQWLVEPASSNTSIETERSEGEEYLKLAKTALDKRLGELSSVHLHPENQQLVSAAWCSDKH